MIKQTMSRRRPRWLRGLAGIAVGAVAAATLSTSPATAAEANAAYVMAYFTESPNGSGNSDTVHLAVSKDALEWTPLNDNQPILVPTTGTGGIRDPYLQRLQDGTWILAATDINNGNFEAANPNIHIWTSPDLVNWSADRLLSINSGNANSFTWAPDIYWDASRAKYGIAYATNPTGGKYGTIDVVYTSDFKTVSAPSVLFDNNGQGGVIDPDVQVGVNGVNYLYYRSPAPNSSGLMGAKSTSLNPGSFSPYTSGIYQNGCVEAPTVVHSLTNSAVWWLWGDNYCPNNVFNVWQGNISTGSWTPLSQQNYTAPLGSKHNTIQAITRTEYTALVNKYGTMTTTRLKSWNFPDRYVRHQNGVGRIDPLPFDPQADSQWKVVSGLAGTGTVSLQSVNFPGSYLRHSNFKIVLANNDGSAQFAADASFKEVPGLANSSWTSLQSYNYPDRYIRHSNFVLELDPVSNATDYADATFHLVP